MFVHGTPTPDVPSGDMQIVFEHGTPAPDVAPAAPPPLPPPPPPRHEPPIAAFQPPPPVEPPPLRKSMEWSPADVPAIRPSGATRAPVEEPPPPVLAPRDPSLLRPRRTHLYIPVVPILTILVAAGAVVVGVIVAKSKLAERSRAAAVADSLRAVAAADSARRAAVPTVGWIQLVGDLPEDAILWLDTNQMNSRLFSATPGSHNVEVEADEFEPWERRVMVRLGDTIQVMVELNLRPQPESP